MRAALVVSCLPQSAKHGMLVSCHNFNLKIQCRMAAQDQQLYPEDHRHAHACYNTDNQFCGCHQLYVDKSGPGKAVVEGPCSLDCTKQQCVHGRSVTECRRARYRAPQCRVHGCWAEKGSREFIKAVRDAGFDGRIYVQWPLKLQGHKFPNGRFSNRSLRLDVMLVRGPNEVGKHSMTPVEVQGTSHVAATQQGRDQTKGKHCKQLGLDLHQVHVSDFVTHAPTAMSSSSVPRRSAAKKRNYAHVDQSCVIDMIMQSCSRFQGEELTMK